MSAIEEDNKKKLEMGIEWHGEVTDDKPFKADTFQANWVGLCNPKADMLWITSGYKKHPVIGEW